MAARRVTSKKPHRLIQDDDGHWYIIPIDLVEDFNAYVSSFYELIQDKKYSGIDYEQFRINGPHTLKIYSWAEDV